MQKPTSITVFAILNLALGVLGILGSGFSVIMLVVSRPGTNPVYDVLQQTTLMRLWTYASVSFGAVFALVLVVSGVGLLMSREWGRLLAILYGIGSVVLGVAGTVINVTVLMPALARLTDSSSPDMMAAAVGGMVGGAIGGCLGLVYPVLLLIFMTRPRVVAYLRQESPRYLDPM